MGKILESFLRSGTVERHNNRNLRDLIKKTGLLLLGVFILIGCNRFQDDVKNPTEKEEKVIMLTTAVEKKRSETVLPVDTSVEENFKTATFALG